VLIPLSVILTVLVLVGLSAVAIRFRDKRRLVALGLGGGILAGVAWIAGTFGYADNRVYFTKGTVVNISSNRDSVCISRPEHRNRLLRVLLSTETTVCYTPTSSSSTETLESGERVVAGWSFLEPPDGAGQGVLLYVRDVGEDD
jgi:hypothetical protein